MHKAGGVLANILPPCVGLTRFGLGGNFTKRAPECPRNFWFVSQINRLESSNGET
jgi:hypothetical protein